MDNKAGIAMGKAEYLGKLSYELRDLPYDQVSDAIEYYQSYLNDVGEANMEAAIEQLGTPETVAGKIRANLGAPPVAPSQQGNPSGQGKPSGNPTPPPEPASSFFERHDVADPKPQKNVNPYSKKNYYEEHGIQRPQKKESVDTSAGSEAHKTATIIGIIALVLCIAWIPIAIVLLILGLKFAIVPTVIILLIGGGAFLLGKRG